MSYNVVWGSHFYWRYKIPNFDEFLSKIENYTEKDIDNTVFKWGSTCDCDRIPLLHEDWQSLVQPSLELLSNDICRNFRYEKFPYQYLMFDPWINFYKRNQYQEIHDHTENALVCVMFFNKGPDFASFYFYDRNNTCLDENMKQLLQYKNIHHPYYEAGDVIFFPGHMLHGVTPHKSDQVRKTFSVNFNLATTTKGL
tara:strand:+ start:76 stop:666 length:591 start_codon:yes stop_codon:yes gene_type:complete